MIPTTPSPVLDLARLDGRVAIVVGGAGHIGSVAASTLASVGAHVVIADIDAARADDVAAAIRSTGGSASARRVDLEDEADCRALVAGVGEDHGRIDVLAHTAALVGTSPLPGWAVAFEEQNVDTWRRALEVNLTSVFVLAQAAAPLLSATGNGSVVVVSSIYGQRGPDPSLYTGTPLGAPAGYFASKGGLDNLTRWLSVSMAPTVRVNAVSPGGIARGQHPDFVERYTAKTPLGRMGAESDLAGAFLYFASDLSRYVTGQNLVVDGGLTAR